jgi:hypothetical protein
LDYLIKSSQKDLSDRKLEAYAKYAKILQWGRQCPVRYCERFYGIELLDHQRFVFMKSWITPRNVWCQSRGSGKTTLLAPFVMAKSNLFAKHQSYIMSGVGSQSQECFLKIERIAKNEIASFTGLTDFFLGEIEVNNAASDGFIHNPSSFTYKLFNDSRVNSLNGAFDNNRSKRSNLNIYDESGFAPEDLFVTSMPFITQDSNFALGGNIDLEIKPRNVPNQAIFASSASDMSTYFYRNAYKEYAKRMFLGDKDYYVADVNAEIVFNATYNGKIYPVSLLSKKEVDDEMRKNKEKALREYYNKFSVDGGDQQPFKRSVIRKNSIVRLPELRNVDNKRYVFAYDPARQFDNAMCLVAEIYNDPKVGYKMNICNGVGFIDIQKKTKTQMRYPKQLQIIKQMVLDYNGTGKLDYENIEKILIDSGSGGGGRFIADDLMEDWTDKNNHPHKGLIDNIEHIEYLSQFPNAIDKLKLLSPKKYKVEMFDSLVEMLNLDLISFTADYDNKGVIMLYKDNEFEYEDEIDGTKKKDINREMYEHILSFEEEVALIQIDLAKEELANIYRYDTSNGGCRYDLSTEQSNKMHDDRAYCLAMLGWYLAQLRHGQITDKDKPSINMSDYFISTGISHASTSSSFPYQTNTNAFSNIFKK